MKKKLFILLIISCLILSMLNLYIPISTAATTTDEEEELSGNIGTGSGELHTLDPSNGDITGDSTTVNLMAYFDEEQTSSFNLYAVKLIDITLKQNNELEYKFTDDFEKCIEWYSSWNFTIDDYFALGNDNQEFMNYLDPWLQEIEDRYCTMERCE